MDPNKYFSGQNLLKDAGRMQKFGYVKKNVQKISTFKSYSLHNNVTVDLTL